MKWKQEQCPLNQLADNGLSVLQVAARYDWSGESLRYLLNTWPDRVNVNWERPAELGGGTVLHAAVTGANLAAVSVLRDLRSCCIDLSVKDAAGRTPLDIAHKMVGKRLSPKQSFYMGGREQGFLSDYRLGEFNIEIITKLTEIQQEQCVAT